MTPKPPPLTPSALPLEEALARSAPLLALRTRVAGSNARFEAIRGVVPEGLQAHLRPGPLDELGWSLLASNAAVAAKLRQLQPRLEQTLRDAGCVPASVRIKVVPSTR